MHVCNQSTIRDISWSPGVTVNTKRSLLIPSSLNCSRSKNCTQTVWAHSRLLVLELGIWTWARLVLQPFVIEGLFYNMFFEFEVRQQQKIFVERAYLYNGSSFLKNFWNKYAKLENFTAHATPPLMFLFGGAPRPTQRRRRRALPWATPLVVVVIYNLRQEREICESRKATDVTSRLVATR